MDKKAEIKALAEADLETFIRLIHPNRVLGSIHSRLCRWWNREDAKSHQLVLLPRDHQKSTLLGYRAAHAITRNPAVRILYISSTSNLAIKQLKFIKDILTSDAYRFYWPEMVHPDEAKREKWTNLEIAVDHPLRKEMMVRDPTVWAAGLTTNIVGMHSDINCLDDVVTIENAKTEEGRSRVERQYGFLSSIESAESVEWVVGTRYDPLDQYQKMQDMRVQIYGDDGELEHDDPLFELFPETEVEVNGEFLWPRQKNAKGNAYGFNNEILARKKAQYQYNLVDFYAQYYNDPNRAEGIGLSKDSFQYYDRSHLSRNGGQWYFRQNRLNVFAAIDFAFSLRKAADFTTIVVAGMDANHNYYVLDIDRFKTNQIGDYFQHLLQLHQKWDFRVINAEVTAAQEIIVEDLKQNYIRKHGLALGIKTSRPTRNEGTKEERVNSILRPKYDNSQMWHYYGGNCEILEAELTAAKPPHDDVKDALAMAVSICMAPSYQRKTGLLVSNSQQSFSRFGGVG